MLEKKEPWRPKKEKGVQNAHLKTREKIAKEMGVNTVTIHRDAQLAEAVENLQDEIPIEKIKENPKKDIIELNKKPEVETLRLTSLGKTGR